MFVNITTIALMKIASFLNKDEIEILNSTYVSETFKGIDSNLSEPLFTIGNFGLNARDAAYWDEKGILPNHCGTGKRRKYNLVQGTWIKLIQQLRELGVATDTIKNLKTNLLEESISLNDILRNPKAKEAMELYLKTIGQLEAFEKAQKNSTFSIDANKPILSAFGMMVKYSVVFRKPFAIMVFKDGSYLPNNLNTLRDLNEQFINIEDILNTPHSVVSISMAYQSLVVGWSSEHFFQDLGIITEQEKEILKLLKEPNLSSVEVIFKNEKIDLLKICKEEGVTPAHRLSDIISKNGYHDIVIKTRNGKPIFYKNSVLKKIKSTS
jgi:DNA-binding transcriptional MerR regulator